MAAQSQVGSALQRHAPLAVLLLSLGVPILLLAPYIASYSLKNDDFALVLHSAKDYGGEFTEWFTNGYSGYFLNYRDISVPYTNFVRPVVNLTFYLESLLAPHAGNKVCLLSNYLLLIINPVLFLFFVKRCTSTSFTARVAAVVMFIAAPGWLDVYIGAAYRTHALMGFFALCAFLSLPTSSSRAPVLRLMLSSLLQTAAMLSHEIGVAVPTAAALLFILGGQRPRLGRLPCLLFLVPYLIIALLRLHAIESAFDGAYVFAAPGERPILYLLITLGLGILKILVTPFFVVDWADLPDKRDLQAALPDLAIVAVNLACYTLIGLACLHGRRIFERPALALLLCFGVSIAPVALLAPEARHTAVAIVFVAALVPLLADRLRVVAPDRSNLSARLGTTMLILLPAILLVGSWHRIFEAAQAGLQANERATGLYGALVSLLAEPMTKTILLINDGVGGYGSKAMLQMAARAAAKPDRRLITVNHLLNVPYSESPGAELRVAREGGCTRIEIVRSESQRFGFLGAAMPLLLASRTNEGVRYEFDVGHDTTIQDKVMRWLGLPATRSRPVLGRRLVAIFCDREMASVIGLSPHDGSVVRY